MTRSLRARLDRLEAESGSGEPLLFVVKSSAEARKLEAELQARGETREPIIILSPLPDRRDGSA